MGCFQIFWVVDNRSSLDPLNFLISVLIVRVLNLNKAIDIV